MPLTDSALAGAAIFDLMPWDPMRDLLTMQERLESLFGRATTGWVPAMDLTELDDRYVLSVELPGLRREDVKIDAQEQTLTVHGQRPGEICCPERYQQLERGQGDFSRSLHFPQPVATSAITAELASGVLTVVVPKVAARTTPRRHIDID
jgi:HSP20 family protein